MSERQQLDREYHGCRVVSTETGEGEQRDQSGEITSDGWDHVVFRRGVEDSQHGTLAFAIRRAREINAARQQEDIDTDAVEDSELPHEGQSPTDVE